MALTVLARADVTHINTRAPAALCRAHDGTFWPWLTWSDFATLSEPENDLVIVPLCGFSDGGLGHALDSEETVLLSVLAGALAGLPGPKRTFVTPPLRFAAGDPEAGSFVVDTNTVISFLEEVLASVKAAGFRRIVLYNSSPWNEEIVDAVARDVRISNELQMFCVNLSALDLDFHPRRSRNRQGLQSLLSFLHGRAPEASPATSTRILDGLTTLVEAPTPETPDKASETGKKLLGEATAHLHRLLLEIHAKSSLPNRGRIVTRTYP